MNARKIGYLALLVVLAAAGWYVFVYLYRWEWNRAVVSGIIFLAAEIGLLGALVLDRLARIANRVDNLDREIGERVLSRLRERISLDDVAAVAISHLHADHFSDLIGLRYGLKYGRLRNEPHLPLYAPPGATEFFARTRSEGAPSPESSLAWASASCVFRLARFASDARSSDCARE